MYASGLRNRHATLGHAGVHEEAPAGSTRGKTPCVSLPPEALVLILRIAAVLLLWRAGLPKLPTYAPGRDGIFMAAWLRVNIYRTA